LEQLQIQHTVEIAVLVTSHTSFLEKEKKEKEEKDRQTMLGLAKDSNTNHDEALPLATPFATVLTPQEIEEKLAAIQEEEEKNEPIQDYLVGTGERKENR